jgi:REP-associated tyrosine transposase
MQTFDPTQDFAVFERRLPHWSQAGTITFITWRTWDSIPEKVLRDWQSERDAWLKRHNIDSASHDWRIKLAALDSKSVQEFKCLLSDRWNDHLDACHGACVLRHPELSDIVAKSLRHFDQDRYDITDFVVMPNHVHVLVAFPTEEALLEQCESWKHFMATKINQSLRRRGRFWQQDGFDHLVRSAEQFEYYRRYIAENPKRANLLPREYEHYSKLIPE